MAEIARGTHLPIATGERVFTKWGFREVLEKKRRDDPPARPLPRRRHHRGAADRRHGRGVLRRDRAAQPARADLAGRRHPARRVDPELPLPGAGQPRRGLPQEAVRRPRGLPRPARPAPGWASSWTRTRWPTRSATTGGTARPTTRTTARWSIGEDSPPCCWPRTSPTRRPEAVRGAQHGRGEGLVAATTLRLAEGLVGGIEQLEDVPGTGGEFRDADRDRDAADLRQVLRVPLHVLAELLGESRGRPGSPRRGRTASRRWSSRRETKSLARIWAAICMPALRIACSARSWPRSSAMPAWRSISMQRTESGSACRPASPIAKGSTAVR